MSWMGRQLDCRLDPRRLLGGAVSVISVAVNYFHPAARNTSPLAGRISRYAWGGDYHKLVKQRLLRLLDHLRRERPDIGARFCVDTGTVLEKPWAHRAGVGWVGKSGNLITRGCGSWVFLGEIIVDSELEPDAPATDYCGSCRRCIDACPTGAIVAPRVIDARRCISYLTIEHRGAIDPGLRAGMGNWLFGCDVCQDVCPWNKFQRPSDDGRWAPRAGNTAPRLAEMAALDRPTFDTRFRGTNVRRTGWRGFLRNTMIALGNCGNPAAAGAPLAAGLAHQEPLVRRHAAWALGRLGERRPLRARAAVESEEAVQEEITRALEA
jgi:epoxyqueuosine reductase